MTSPADQPDSLDQAVTRTGDESRSDSTRPPGDTVASLGELETGADSRSSLADLADIGEDSDTPQEIVDLAERYELGEPLGRGGMGEVISAIDRRLKRSVAIKRIRADLGASRTAMRRFLTEAVSVAALNHFNVVQVYDYGHTADGPFLVMELIEGSTLSARLSEGALPLDEAIEMCSQLCDGLQAAHDRGIVHRDIKPANILLTASGTPKLTDFGLAKDVSDTGNTQAGAVLGTLDYMPPEQKADSSRADARSDQWSLAATFYQMVTGKLPRVIRLHDLPTELQPVVERALEENPVARYDSVREFGLALRQSAAGENARTLDRTKLQEGQCTGCGTVNAVDRQFCRDCGGSLRESCPDCGTEAGAWERFCGSCGTDIAAALAARVDEAEELVRQVQSLHDEHRYDEALTRIESLLGAAHPALQPQQEWAEKTRERITQEQAEYEARRTQLLSEAREQHAAGNLSTALQVLDRLPEHLRNDECRQLVNELSMAAMEAKRLAAEISKAVRSRQYDGLAARVERYLELKPRDEKARRLLEKLRERKVRGETAASERQSRSRTAAASLAQLPGGSATIDEPPPVINRKSSRQQQPKSLVHMPVLLGVFAAVAVAAGGWFLFGRDGNDLPAEQVVVGEVAAGGNDLPAEQVVVGEVADGGNPSTGVSGSSESPAADHEPAKLRQVWTMQVGEGAAVTPRMERLTFSPDGQSILTDIRAVRAQGAVLLNVADGSEQGALPASLPVRSAVHAASKEHAYVAVLDNSNFKELSVSVEEWQLNPAQRLRILPSIYDREDKTKLNSLATLECGENGHYLAAVYGVKDEFPNDEAVLAVWNLRTGELSYTLHMDYMSWPWFMRFSHDEQLLCVAGRMPGAPSGNYAVFFESSTGRVLREVSAVTHLVDAAFLPDDSAILFGGLNGVVDHVGISNPAFFTKWDELGRRNQFRDGNEVACDANFSYTCLMNEDGRIAVWEIATGRLIREFDNVIPASHGGSELALSPDGRHLAVAQKIGTKENGVMLIIFEVVHEATDAPDPGSDDTPSRGPDSHGTSEGIPAGRYQVLFDKGQGWLYTYRIDGNTFTRETILIVGRDTTPKPLTEGRGIIHRLPDGRLQLQFDGTTWDGNPPTEVWSPRAAGGGYTVGYWHPAANFSRGIPPKLSAVATKAVGE